MGAPDHGTSAVRVGVLFVDTSEPATFKSRLESWFPRGTHLTVSTIARPSTPCSTNGESNPIAVWLTFPVPDRVSVTFSYCDAKTKFPRYILRHLPLPGGMDELGQERLAQSIHSSVVALLDGRVDEVGVEVEAPNSNPRSSSKSVEPPSTTRNARHLSFDSALPSHPSSAKPIRGWIGIGYSATLRGVEGLALGPLLRGGLGRKATQVVTYGLLFEGRLFVPNRFERKGLSIQTSGARTLLGIYADGRIGRDWSLATELTVGLDINHYVSSSSTNGSYESVNDGTDYQVLFSPALHLLTTDVIEFGFGVHLDVLPARTRYYTMSAEGDSQVVATPWRFQPGISVLLRWPGHNRVTR